MPVKNVPLAQFAATLLKQGIYVALLNHVNDADPVGLVSRTVVNLIEQGLLIPIDIPSYQVVDVGSDEWANGAYVLTAYGIVTDQEVEEIQIQGRSIPQWSVIGTTDTAVIIQSDLGVQEAIIMQQPSLSVVASLLDRRNQGLI
jgi:hypothetical protein